MLGDSMEWFGTGHSERATLTSGLAALGVNREERDPLGRWCVDGSVVYVRGYKGLVRRLVGKFVGVAGAKEGFEALDEADAVTELSKVFDKRGIGPGGKAMKARLLGVAKRYFAGLPGRKGTVGNSVEEAEVDYSKVNVIGPGDGGDEKKDLEEEGYIASVS